MKPTHPTPSPTAVEPPCKNSRPLTENLSLLVWISLLFIVNLPLVHGGIRTSLIFVPEAVADGEWWRILTHPFVHLSWYHLLLDAGGFLLLFRFLEERRCGVRLLYLLGTGAGALLLSLAADPALAERGLCGLSGIAHGLMAVSALEMVRHREQRSTGLACLGIVVFKAGYELWSGRVILDFMHMGMCGEPVAACHAGGVIGGILSFALVGLCRSGRWLRTEADGSSGRFNRLVCRLILLGARLSARIMYRVRYEGLHRIPQQGPAVLVCNHVSYVDWLIIAGGSPRPVSFVMHTSIYETPLLRWLFRLTGAIPIDSGRRSPALLRRAFSSIDRLLHSGGLLCIFPEGHLTRDGRIGRFRPGIEKIIERTPVPVIPMALDGLWGSFFSHRNGRAMRHRPRLRRLPVILSVGRSCDPLEISANHLQSNVQRLRDHCTGKSPFPNAGAPSA